MVKLVMVYVETDGYTYSTDVQMPFEYESVDKAYDDFKNAYDAAIRAGESTFRFNSFEFHTSIFKDATPSFLTLDTWFDLYKDWSSIFY